jgi:hypothetical protein
MKLYLLVFEQMLVHTSLNTRIVSQSALAAELEFPATPILESVDQASGSAQVH